MANITQADARRLDQLKLRWREIRMKKLQSQLNDTARDFAESCAEVYAELYGEHLSVISAEYVHEDSYSGYMMRFCSNGYVSEDRMIDLQSNFAEKLNKTMDFKILSDNEFEMFIMMD